MIEEQGLGEQSLHAKLQIADKVTPTQAQKHVTCQHRPVLHASCTHEEHPFSSWHGSKSAVLVLHAQQAAVQFIIQGTRAHHVFLPGLPAVQEPPGRVSTSTGNQGRAGWCSSYTLDGFAAVPGVHVHQGLSTPPPHLRRALH